MRFAAHYLGDYKKESLLAPVFKMLEAIFELLVPLVMAKIIDVGIANKDAGYILKMCGVLIIFAVVGLVVAIIAQYFSAKAAINAAGKIREDVFFHIMKFSRGSLEKAGTASLVTRITNDVNQVQNGMNMFLRLFLRSPFIVFGAMIMSFTVDVKAALVFCVVIPLLGLIVYLVMRATLPKFKRIQEGLEKILLTVNENLEGVRVIRAFRVEDKQDRRFKDETADLYGRQISTGRLSALLNPATYAVINLGIASILWISGARVNAGILTQGETVALVNYMSQILIELIKLANLIILLTRALSSCGRLQEILEMNPDERVHEEAAAKESDDTAIEFKNLSFTYPGSRDSSLSDINVSIKKGQSLGIIGGTGSGKSSLVRLLRHAYDPTSGELLLFGNDIKTYSDEELVKMIGHVPQKANLFTGTISYNLRLAKPDASEQEMWDALEAAQAKEIVENKEKKLEEPVLRGGTNFSGGQKQRLTIARALIKKPQILILDDSASALDMLTERHLHEAILKLPWHPTSVIISQRASSVMTCDQILVLEGGKPVGLGTSDELLKTCPIYKEIYTTQFEYKEEGRS
ncbi:MAG: ABC transporter ATP-binding protein [Lachnospiraceae bacterium]|uniref:ABC transporter ATP-binding protein n=1 Tax=Candidatus Weimeria bifida TaxID=2599074 RepID=A0A6N7J2G9_9FIRM|nr:ABC transporter ATP-binding protein [Candidatus Weimeria bifida]RRF97379.1 MAG: ABC transporter ATP-binding protein [Lachnospiraceae bacterium]